MNGMFTNANAFNGDISSWDVSRVEDMYQMFTMPLSSTVISRRDVSRVVTMYGMFYGASSFEQTSADSVGRHYHWYYQYVRQQRDMAVAITCSGGGC